MAGTSTIAASARQEEQEVATSTTSEAERRKAAGASLGQKNSRWSRVNKLKGAAARSGKVKYREEVHEHVDVKAAAPPAKRAATEADMGEELMKNRIFPVSLMASAEAHNITPVYIISYGSDNRSGGRLSAAYISIWLIG